MNIYEESTLNFWICQWYEEKNINWSQKHEFLSTNIPITSSICISMSNERWTGIRARDDRRSSPMVDRSFWFFSLHWMSDADDIALSRCWCSFSGTEPGADPGFQVREGALKKFASSGGWRENCWGISCEKHYFTPKNHIFSNFRGGGAGCVPPPPLDPPLSGLVKTGKTGMDNKTWRYQF